MTVAPYFSAGTTRAQHNRGAAVFLVCTLLVAFATTGCRSGGAAAAAGNEAKPSAGASADAGGKDAGDAAKDGDATAAAAAAAMPTVSVGIARVGVIEKGLPVTGTLTVPRDRQATIVAPVAGILDALPVRLNDSVRAGQEIAHLSTRLLAGQIAQAQATVGQDAVQVQQAEANAVQQQGQTRSTILQAQSSVSGARATLAGAEATLTGDEAAVTNARQSLARTQTLFTDGLVARKDVEAAQLAVQSAEAQAAAQRQTVAAQREAVSGQEQAVQAARAAGLQDVVKRKDIQVAQEQLQNARAALQTLQAQRALYSVRAPVSGRITSVGASIGESVDTTTKIATIADIDRLQLQIAVPTASAAAVRAGQTVTFTTDTRPGRTYRAAIRTVGTEVDPASNTVTALADIDNRDHALADGMYAHVHVVTERRSGALLVPRSAVLFDPAGGAPSVARLDADNTAHVVTVRTGLTDERSVEILSGLKADDRVVTTGAYGLPDGAKVQVDTGGKTP